MVLASALLCVAWSSFPVIASPIVSNTALDSTQVSSQESNFGDLVADAVRGAAPGDAQIAIVPANEIRSEVIPAGKIDTQQIASALRAASDTSDTVVLVHLTGAQIKRALDHGLSRLPAPFAGFLQVSGLRVLYATGAHGPEVSAVLLSGSSDSLDDNKTYTVATTRLLADGALGYFEVWNKGDIDRDTGIPLAKAVTEFAAAHQPLDYQTDGRIRAR